MDQDIKHSKRQARNAGFFGCLPSLILAISATSLSINYNLFATFLSLGFGIGGVIGMIGAYVSYRKEQKGEIHE